MKQLKKISVVLLTFALIGCGCSSSSDPAPANSSAEATGNDPGTNSTPTDGAMDTPSTATDGGTETANPDGAETNPTASNEDGIISPGDPNPGSIPDPILAESTDLNIADFSGYKVYAGPDTAAGPSTDLGYINLEFDCDGTGTFEVYPTDQIQFLEVTKGNMTWEVSATSANVGITIVDYTQGDEFTVPDLGISDVDPSTATMVVGQTKFNDLLVSRILAYKQCP